MSDPDPHSSPAPRDSVLKDLEARCGAASRILLPDSAHEESPLLAANTGREGTLAVRRGAYQVLGEIARGGVGVILKSHDPDLGRDVAMKVLRDEFKDDPALLQRFVEEAQISGQLQHPGIAPVYEMGLREDQQPYFTMKLIKGRTLSALLDDRDDPAKGRHRYLRIFEQVCQTVAYAHSRGVIHRDLKPANVMVGAFGEVQVMDWGFAKVLARGGVDDEKRALARESVRSIIHTVRSGPGSSTQSLAGSVLGTPSNMPPEQARGEIEKTDERSDVFSLGGILVEILTGQSLYGGEEDPIVAAAECRLDRTMARLDACGADAELLTLCKSCLAPAPVARPRNAEVVTRRLQDYLSAVEERAREAELRATRARGRQRLTVVVAGFLLLLAVGGGGGKLWIDAQRARHRQTVEGAISAAVTEASTSFGLARGDDSGELTHWDEALAALQRVEPLVADPVVAAATREQVARLQRDIREDRARAEDRFTARSRNQAFLRELRGEALFRAANLEGQELWPVTMDRYYATVFAKYDLDVAGMSTDEACLAVADHPLAFELAEALDDWARNARNPNVKRDWKRLVQIAQAADPDEGRNQVRDAVLDQDVGRLLELAADVRVSELAAPTLTLLGNSLWMEDRLEEALALMRIAHQHYPDDEGVNGLLGFVLWDNPAFRAEAPRYYFALLALNPDHLRLRQELVTLLTDLGEKEPAIALARDLVDRTPGVNLTRGILAHVLFEFREIEEAVELLRGLVADGVDYPDLHLTLAAALDLLGDQEGEVEQLRRVLELENVEDSHLEAHMSLGRLAWQDGDVDRAIEELLVSNSIIGRYLLGLIYLQREDAGEARFHLSFAFRELRKAIERRETSTRLPGELAYWLAACPLDEFRDDAQALRIAETVVEKVPQRGPPWTVLALARLRAGDAHGALRAVQSSRSAPLGLQEQEPCNPFIECLAYTRLGDLPSARAAYERGLVGMREPRSEALVDARLKAHWLQQEAAEAIGR